MKTFESIDARVAEAFINQDQFAFFYSFIRSFGTAFSEMNK